jgi:hypothetical protein
MTRPKTSEELLEQLEFYLLGSEETIRLKKITIEEGSKGGILSSGSSPKNGESITMTVGSPKGLGRSKKITADEVVYASAKSGSFVWSKKHHCFIFKA